MSRSHAVARDVAVVVNTFNDHDYLPDALDSVARQTVAPREVIVVDDGSDEDPGPILSRHSAVRLIRQPNAGLAAARNAGLAAATARYILFLDADDMLLPSAIARGLACFATHPEAGFVYGAHRRVDAGGRPITPLRYTPAGPDGLDTFLRGNAVGMHAAVLYHRQRLVEAGGFDEGLSRCEDYDVYLRMAAHHPVASHPAHVSDYRIHGSNMSRDSAAMLSSVLGVLDAHAPSAGQGAARRRAWRAGRRAFRDHYAEEAAAAAATSGAGPVGTAKAAAALSPRWAVGAAMRRLTASPDRPSGSRLSYRLRRIAGHPASPPRGRVRFGDLGTTAPVSADFGWDRGTPTDRYYVEAFLARFRDDVQGRVLEIGDDAYSRRFGGGRITRQDVLHVDRRNPDATIYGDISRPDVLPDASFDCIILTQTLHLIYDMASALDHLHAALKPGGVLLVTVPGISQIDRGEWGESWYWSLTRPALLRLLEEAFGRGTVEAVQYGNVFSATSFLQGVAVEELDRRQLDVEDPAYPVIVAGRAVKHG